MNKYDSELLGGILESCGYLPAASADEADVIIVNTCAVRKHAEDRATGQINKLAGWKKQRSGRRLGVVGCMAKNQGEGLLKAHPFLDFIIGPDQYKLLPEILSGNSGKPAVVVDFNHTENYNALKPARTGNPSGWVAITRGCNNFCSYCIVPYTRGRERSRPADEILREIEQMVEQGFKEITLLGQNVNSYHDQSIDFPELLRQCARVQGVWQIRYMTSHPKDLSPRLLDVMCSEETIAPHIHLPAQAGSDRILKLMNRKYTRKHYLNLIAEARRRMPSIALSTDIMVGFPTETEEEFLETCSLLEEVRFDDAYLYHFSPRPGTPAAELDGQIPEAVRLERLDRLITLQRQISAEKKLTWIGSTVEVLPETESRHSPKEWIGRTPRNQTVVFPKERTLAGEPVFIYLDELSGATLRGHVAIEDRRIQIKRRQQCGSLN